MNTSTTKYVPSILLWQVHHQIYICFILIIKCVISVLVNCGNHYAANCSECPQGNGQYWCNGVCEWNSTDDKCELKQGLN